MAYDSESDQVILFGGETNPHSGAIGGTWAYDLGEHKWREMSPDRNPAPGAGGDSFAYDIQSDRVIMFVGSYFYGANQNPPGKAAGETWAFDFNNDTWADMQPAVSPFGIVGARMAYDEESDRMILFGGADADSFEPVDATWAYDFDSNSWEKLDPPVAPPPMNFHSMAYDSRSDRVILLGTALAEGMWAYDFNSDTWEPLLPRAMPPFRAYSSMVYDAGSDQMILFGGASTPTEEALGDTWAYDTADNTWTELTTDTQPDARGWHATAYSMAARMVLLFGGGPDREKFTSETWVYDPARNLWRLELAAP